MITFGIIAFLLLSFLLFPYLIVGGILKFFPVFTSRRWLVSVVALILPFIIRFGFGYWSFRLGNNSSGELISELPSAIGSLAFSHVFVWAGFFSVDKFIIGMREESKLVKPSINPRKS